MLKISMDILCASFEIGLGVKFTVKEWLKKISKKNSNVYSHNPFPLKVVYIIMNIFIREHLQYYIIQNIYCIHRISYI
jgi:hypothetical protein